MLVEEVVIEEHGGVLMVTINRPRVKMLMPGKVRRRLLKNARRFGAASKRREGYVSRQVYLRR
jgi:hypothetical protein